MAKAIEADSERACEFLLSLSLPLAPRTSIIHPARIYAATYVDIRTRTTKVSARTTYIEEVAEHEYAGERTGLRLQAAVAPKPARSPQGGRNSG